MSLKHNDCLNFSPIDAVKGICRLTKDIVNIDSGTCKNIAIVPKCKNCKHFGASDVNGIGLCKGLSKDDWTFESLNAITCKGHEFKQER